MRRAGRFMVRAPGKDCFPYREEIARRHHTKLHVCVRGASLEMRVSLHGHERRDRELYAMHYSGVMAAKYARQRTAMPGHDKVEVAVNAGGLTPAR